MSAQPFQFRPAEPHPAPVREQSKRRGHAKLRPKSPPIIRPERASEPFNLEEAERRDEERRRDFALLKPEPQRYRSRSTGDAPVERQAQGLRSQQDERGVTERRSADMPRTRPFDGSEFHSPISIQIEDLRVEDSQDSQKTFETVIETHRNSYEVYELVLENLAAVGTRCVVNASASPEDWSRIAELVDEQHFVLKMWAEESGLASLPDTERQHEGVRAAERILKRLGLRVLRIQQLLTSSNQRVLQPFEGVTLSQVEADVSEDEGISGLPNDYEEKPSWRLKQEMKGMDAQIRSLQRLTRSLQEMKEREEMAALADHISEVQRHFGSAEAVARSGVLGVVPGDVALKEARRKCSQSLS